MIIQHNKNKKENNFRFEFVMIKDFNYKNKQMTKTSGNFYFGVHVNDVNDDILLFAL